MLIKPALWLHTQSYLLCTGLAPKVHGGVHPKHEIMRYREFFLSRIRPGDTVLDVGCSTGIMTEVLAGKAGKITAIELVPWKVEEAKRLRSRPNIEYITGDAVTYVFKDKFDVAVVSNVLEHIENRVEMLRKIKSLAARMLVRVPMIDRDWITVYKKRMNVDYRLDSTHRIEYTLEEFKNEVKEAELMIEEHTIQFGELWASLK